MIKNVALCLFLAFGFSVCSGQVQERIIKVIDIEITSYEDSLVLAENENKKVFLFFLGDHCSWCSKQKEVILQEEVVKKLNDYIVCYVDLSERKDLASKYNVKVIPTYFIINKNEKILNKNIGYKNKNDFIKWLDN